MSSAFTMNNKIKQLKMTFTIKDNQGGINIRFTLFGWDMLRFERMILSDANKDYHYYGVKILWIKVMFWCPLFDL